MPLIDVHVLIAKYNGKPIEASGSKPGDPSYNQCVDLANQYLADSGLPKVLHTNAFDFPAKIGADWEFIPASPTRKPEAGDLVIWKPEPGHIAVCIESTLTRFSSFDENFPVGSVAHVQEHTYQNVIGWLHYKKGDSMTELEQAFKDRDRNWNFGVVEAQILGIQLDEKETPDQLKKRAQDALDALKRQAFEEGKNSVPTPQPLPQDPSIAKEPPKSLDLASGTWDLNGIQYIEGKLAGNYEKRR